MGLIRCPKCNAMCNDDDKVCHYCGYKFKSEDIKKDNNTKVENDPAKAKVKEPQWITDYRSKSKKPGYVFLALFLICVILCVVFLIFLVNDTEKTFNRSDIPKTKWMVSLAVCGVGGFMFLMLGIMMTSGTFYVKKIEGYFVVVHDTVGSWKLIIENKEVDRHFISRYDYTNETKLSGRLPNKKMLLVKIEFNGNHKLTYEVFEDSKN